MIERRQGAVAFGRPRRGRLTGRLATSPDQSPGPRSRYRFRGFSRHATPRRRRPGRALRPRESRRSRCDGRDVYPSLMRIGSLVVAGVLLCLAVTLCEAVITRDGVGTAEYITSIAI